METKEHKLSNRGGKAPLYVETYEKISEQIKSGELKPSEKLPGEYELSDMFEVSRGTLRQALLLLQEDGLIYNRHGIGNFVTTKSNGMGDGLEKSAIIPKEFSKKPCEVVLKDITYQPASKTVQNNLELDKTILIALFELAFIVEDEVIGSMSIFLPYEIIDTNNLSLDDNESMLEFILDYLENQVDSSSVDIRMVEAKENMTENLDVEEGTPIVVFYEIMYSSDGVPVIYSKSYCNPIFYNFYMNRKN